MYCKVDVMLDIRIISVHLFSQYNAIIFLNQRYGILIYLLLNSLCLLWINLSAVNWY